VLKIINLKNVGKTGMNKLHFITFANTAFMKTHRIIKQVEEFNMFDEIVSYDETMIESFIRKHYTWITHTPKFGMFIWKPHIILKTLESARDNDVIVYCDAGIHANAKGIERFKYYLDQLKDKDIVVFSTSDMYVAQDFVKADAVAHYNPEFFYENDTMVYAGIMIVKKTANTTRMIQEWLDLCENYHFLDSSPSFEYMERSTFKGNDKDNGLFNLVLSKYRDQTCRITPDEINIIINGKQVAHTDIPASQIDWSVLDNVPFQVRRDRPSD
jgi:hypothetical protein